VVLHELNELILSFRRRLLRRAAISASSSYGRRLLRRAAISASSFLAGVSSPRCHFGILFFGRRLSSLCHWHPLFLSTGVVHNVLFGRRARLPLSWRKILLIVAWCDHIFRHVVSHDCQFSSACSPCLGSLLQTAFLLASIPPHGDIFIRLLAMFLLLVGAERLRSR
jgi:hypothetical protein